VTWARDALRPSAGCSEADPTCGRHARGSGAGTAGPWGPAGAGAEAGPGVVAEDPEVRQTLAQIAYAVRRKSFEGSS
jgi:hypothetical protein